MTRTRVFVVFVVFPVMTDHSWVENSLACSQKRFRKLLFGTSTNIMLDKGQIGRDYWDLLNRERDTARNLSQLLFTYKMYETYDY
jgi:trans-2-enoyl-CoA reductase